MGALDGYAHVCSYTYLDEDGRYAFEKRRYELLDPLSGDRSKTFRYWDRYTHSYKKPSGADGLIYRLPDVLLAIDSGVPVHWSEGEKDADALRRVGVVATSHHQGANHSTPEQALWLRGVTKVVLWVDLDRGRWEVGAHDALLRHNYLIDAGVPADRITMVRARRGKDAYDHLEKHGLSVAQAVRVNKARLAAVAADYRPSMNRRLGYRHG